MGGISLSQGGQMQKRLDYMKLEAIGGIESYDTFVSPTRLADNLSKYRFDGVERLVVVVHDNKGLEWDHKNGPQCLMNKNYGTGSKDVLEESEAVLETMKENRNTRREAEEKALAEKRDRKAKELAAARHAAEVRRRVREKLWEQKQEKQRQEYELKEDKRKRAEEEVRSYTNKWIDTIIPALLTRCEKKINGCYGWQGTKNTEWNARKDITNTLTGDLTDLIQKQNGEFDKIMRAGCESIKKSLTVIQEDLENYLGKSNNKGVPGNVREEINIDEFKSALDSYE